MRVGRRVTAATLAASVWSGGMIATTVTARAQDPPPLRRYHHTVWPLDDALIGAAAQIARSPDGYLWASGRTALVRFDGVRFTQLDGERVPALRTTGTVGPLGFRPLHVDRRGRMWVLRPDGALLTYADGVFRVVLEPRDSVAYRDVYEDGAGGLWVAADSARRHWIRRLQGDRPVPGTWPTGVPDSVVTSLVPDTADGMWVGSVGWGVWHVTPRGARRYDPPAAIRDRGRMPALYAELQSTDGTVWVMGASPGVQRVHGDRWTTVELDRDPGGMGVGSVKQAPDGSVYLATRSFGVLRWRDGHFERRPPGDGPAGTIAFDVTVDADGTIWASTDLGLERFRRATFMTLGRRDGLPFDVPYEADADASGAIWVTDLTDRLFRLRDPAAREVPDSMTAWRAPLPKGMRYRLLAGARDGVWIARRPLGLVRVDRSGATSIGPAAGLPAATVWTAEEDASGVAWLAMLPAGLGRLRDGRFTRVRLPARYDSSVARISVGDSGRFVVATSSSHPFAYAVAPSGALTRLDSLAPLRRPVELVAVEGRDTVWGRVRSPSTTPALVPPTLVRITGGRATEVPLPARAPGITGFNPRLVVAHGSLWFASRDGVGRLPLDALHAAADRGLAAPAPQTFGPADGLTSPHLTSFALHRMFRSPDGRIWLATPAGLAVVDPADVSVNTTPPPVHVEEVAVGGRVLASDELQRIAPNPERVAIHYTAASLRMPERVRVQYRLDGADRQWVEGSVPRVATYTQLRPGAYRFRVRAWNEDGVPSAGEATLAFRVLPAWYQSRWALAFGLLAAAGVGAAGMGGVASVRRRHAEAEIRGTIAERVRVARELHDTLLSGMAGVAMRLDAAATRAASPAGLDPAVLATLREQAYRTLDDARRSVTVLRASADELIPFWAQVADAARRTFADTDIITHADHTGTPRVYPADVEAEALRVATEAMVNARKHAGCRVVTATCAYDRHGLHVRVRDDGRGFEPAAAQRNGHWGLAGMRERAAAIGAELTISSTPGRGTDVVLTIHPRQT